jgi:hypothetical protein
MISLEFHDKKIQDILRRELNLSNKASFQSRDMLDGTELYEHCLFTITDGDITYILIHGTFVATEVYVLIKTDLPEDFQFPRIAEELKEKGLDPVKTRLVCIAVNTSEKVPGAQKFPEIQIVIIPF